MTVTCWGGNILLARAAFARTCSYGMIVSEPLGDVAGVWNEVPESCWGVVGPNRVEMGPFRPKAPTTTAVVA